MCTHAQHPVDLSSTPWTSTPRTSAQHHHELQTWLDSRRKVHACTTPRGPWLHTVDISTAPPRTADLARHQQTCARMHNTPWTLAPHRGHQHSTTTSCRLG